MKKYLLALPIVIGALCNYLAIWFNGGKMPVNVVGVVLSAQRGYMTDSTKLKMLGDIFLYRHGNIYVIYSVGDILIDIGIISIVAALTIYLGKMKRYVQTTS